MLRWGLIHRIPAVSLPWAWLTVLLWLLSIGNQSFRAIGAVAFLSIHWRKILEKVKRNVILRNVIRHNLIRHKVVKSLRILDAGREWTCVERSKTTIKAFFTYKQPMEKTCGSTFPYSWIQIISIICVRIQAGFMFMWLLWQVKCWLCPLEKRYIDVFLTNMIFASDGNTPISIHRNKVAYWPSIIIWPMTLYLGLR